jgi:hypothetical protein
LRLGVPSPIPGPISKFATSWKSASKTSCNYRILLSIFSARRISAFPSACVPAHLGLTAGNNSIGFLRVKRPFFLRSNTRIMFHTLAYCHRPSVCKNSGGASRIGRQLRVPVDACCT